MSELHVSIFVAEDAVELWASGSGNGGHCGLDCGRGHEGLQQLRALRKGLRARWLEGGE